MERYLGMDVHAESCSFCVLEASGKELRRDVVETNGQARIQYLKQFSGGLHLCYEESEWAGWLWEILSPHVSELVVFRGERKKGSKSDAGDARALAERIRTGQVGMPIFKAPKRFAKLRELAQVYGLLTRDVVRAKNRLRSRFRRRGVRCSGEEVYSFERRKRRLTELPAASGRQWSCWDSSSTAPKSSRRRPRRRWSGRSRTSPSSPWRARSRRPPWRCGRFPGSEGEPNKSPSHPAETRARNRSQAQACRSEGSRSCETGRSMPRLQLGAVVSSPHE